MKKPGIQPAEAAAVIWQPRQVDRDAVAGAELGSARVKALVHGVVGGLIGVLLYFFFSRTLAYVAFGLSGAIMLARLISPAVAGAGVERVFAVAGAVVGRILAYTVLVPMFYLVFLPVGLLTGRRRQMGARPDPGADSYWRDHRAGARDEASYRRQS
jgi:hypothetical protein